MHTVHLEEMSHFMISKADPSTQKTHPCYICALVLKDILHMAAALVQKLYMYGACASLAQKDHTEENPLKCIMDRTSFEKHCEFFVSGKWFNCNDLWKDFPTLFDLVKPQVISNGERPNRAQLEDMFHHGKSCSRLVKSSKAISYKNVAFCNPRIHNGKKLYENRKHEKNFHDGYSLG
ncbi:zinc finger protein 416-like [Castor canadensis]|uniref:Zinc finger protein 416-like n=1 Tax=Castor canadensis TaxID=51338 RepID=A0AC58LBL9_CASCN